MNIIKRGYEMLLKERKEELASYDINPRDYNYPGGSFWKNIEEQDKERIRKDIEKYESIINQR